jgi:hypothetical protein
MLDIVYSLSFRIFRIRHISALQVCSYTEMFILKFFKIIVDGWARKLIEPYI